MSLLLEQGQAEALRTAGGFDFALHVYSAIGARWSAMASFTTC